MRGAPDRALTLVEVARIAHLETHRMPPDLEPGLDATRFYDPIRGTFAAGAQAAIVQVEPETGVITIRRWVCVEDTGAIINPLIVEGQVHGAIAQGIGGALAEHLIYDETGQLLTGTFMEYAMPTASVIPSFETEHIEEPAGQPGGRPRRGRGRHARARRRSWPTPWPTRWRRSASSRIRCRCRRRGCGPRARRRTRLRRETEVAMRSGDHYLASLRDGRAVFLDGERVDDVTKHPAFAAPIRRVAATWDLAARADAQAIDDVRRSRPPDGGTAPCGWCRARPRTSPRAGACTGCGRSRRSGSWGARPTTWPAC